MFSLYQLQKAGENMLLFHYQWVDIYCMGSLKYSLSLLKSLEKLLSRSSVSISLSQKFLNSALKYSVIRARSNSFYPLQEWNCHFGTCLLWKGKNKTPYNSFQELKQKKFSEKIFYLGENTEKPHVAQPQHTLHIEHTLVAVQHWRVLERP